MLLGIFKYQASTTPHPTDSSFIFLACSKSIHTTDRKQTHTTSPNIFISSTPLIKTQSRKQDQSGCDQTVSHTNSPHLLNHSLDLPLLAEHHVVQVFYSLAEIHSFTLQIFGPKHKHLSLETVCWQEKLKGKQEPQIRHRDNLKNTVHW